MRQSMAASRSYRSPVRSAVFLVVPGVAFVAMAANAEESGEHHHGHLMMPEPLIDESITDVDSTEPNQLEVDLTGGVLARLSDGSMLWTSGIEAEYRLLPKLGLACEVGLGAPAPSGAAEIVTTVSVAGSVAVYQNFMRELHMQLQIYGRVFTNESLAHAGGLEVGEPALPFAMRLHGAWRRARLNLRWGLGGGFGTDVPFSPLFANVAMLWEWGAPVLNDVSRGFVGVEVDADGGRAQPLFIIPEVAVHVPLGRSPLRVGLAVPIRFGQGAQTISIGAILRLMLEVHGR